MVSTRTIGAALVAAIVLVGWSPAARAAEPQAFAPTFQEDLKSAVVPLRDDYAKSHPRLLFSAADVPALKDKIKACPELWANVLKHANGLVAREVPDAKTVSSGGSYWRIEFVQSGALAWLLAGQEKHFDASRNWMVRYSEGKIWGEGWNENVDLFAAWYLYHISMAYDIMRDKMTAEDRLLVRDSLAAHAKAIYDHILKDWPGEVRYDQNHTYIPVSGMVTAALAVMDEVPEAKDWIKLGYVMMNRSRYALGTDGYYYEGYGYWSYAMHWHIRYADLMSRATTAAMHDLPILKNEWRFALHSTLPGFPWAYDMADQGYWKDGQRGGSPSVSQHTHLWGLASKLKSGQTQLAGDFLDRRDPELDYPAASFLWFDPSVKAADLAGVEPWSLFDDLGVVMWRSGWDDSATCAMFRIGPPQGHAATAKLKVLKDWIMNSGHVHPDIGAFWFYAKGEYLAGDTGYTAEKYTRDHNTLLVSGKGQGKDGSYWNDRGLPYEKFDRARMEKTYLSKDYAFASGEFSSVYPEDLGLKGLRRTMLVTPRYMLVIDNLESEKPQTLTWFCHTDNPFAAEGPAYVSKKEKAGLAVLPLGTAKLEAVMEPTTVQGGTGPEKATPAQRGHHLKLSTTEPAAAAQLVTLLVPVAAGDKVPAAAFKGDLKTPTLTITWPDGKVETVVLWTNLNWKDLPAGEAPATITVK